MKALALLLCVILHGCEKRSADPELGGMRECLLSEEGQSEIASKLANQQDRFRGYPESLDQLFPVESWAIKRVVNDMEEFDFVGFAIFAEEKTGLKGWLFAIGNRTFQENELGSGLRFFAQSGRPVSD
ncbi:MAG: hypothetical protein AAF514_09160 [Verrucomicrobiota bacterium]